MKKALLYLLLYSITSSGISQDLFVKSYSTIENRNVQIEVMKDGHYVVAGYDSPVGLSSKVFIRKFNPCGIELWSKEISDNNLDMSVADLNVDSNQNIVLTGLHDTYNQAPKPYIIKFDKNGNTLYSKVIESQLGYNNLNYSSSIAPNGDVLLLNIYRYSPSPPNNFKLSMSRIDSNGLLKWTKNYDNIFAGIWSIMTATRDGGAIINMSNFVCKVDSVGEVEWAKDYTGLGSQRKPVETDSGYVFARYFTGGLDRGGFISLRHDGSVDWNTDFYLNFFPFRGITRKNGNLLFPGSNPIIGNSAAFLELDYTNGNTIQFKQNQSINGIFASDIAENAQGDILFTGPDNRGIIPNLAIGKINDTLSTITCQNDILVTQNDPLIVSFNSNRAVVAVNNTDLILSNRNFTLATIAITSEFSTCAYTKIRGNYKLGNDTTLCVGESLILGDINSDFDAYLWSTGSTNKTIGINQSGSYSLSVVSACDTLRDTINVSYLPGVLFSLGPDTIACGDSIILGQNLIPSNNYTWSTGETSTTIIAKTSGVYWVEHNTVCSSYRDSIVVNLLPIFAPINLGADTILCPKQTITLGSTSSPYSQFEWSDGSSSKTINASAAGDYWLKASSTCSVSADTIKVMYYPEIGLDLGADTAICSGDSLILAENLNFNNYLWSDGSTNSTLTVKQVGVYWLEVQTNCGAVRDSITVSEVPSLTPPILFQDTVICNGDSIRLFAENLENYLWSTGETSASITVSDSNTYWVETRNECDTLRDSIHVSYYPPLPFNYTISQNTVFTGDSILFINSTLNSLQPIWNFGNGDSIFADTANYTYQINGSYDGTLSISTPNGCTQQVDFTVNVALNNYFIPNIFSPNNDGVNDLLQPVGKDIEKYETSIYNRWGELIFSSNSAPWDGKNTSDKRAKGGAYNYIIQLTLKNGKQETLKGNVTLIR